MITLAWWPVLLLLPLPALLKRLRRVSEKSGSDTAHSDNSTLSALRVPFYRQALAAGHLDQHQAPPRWSQLMAWLAWAALIAALARPQWVGEAVPVTQNARDLFLAIDLSPSMQEEDMVWRNRRTTRLNVTKAVVSDFIAQREGDRIGLILFGSQPYIQAPLTFDLKTVETLLREAAPGMAGDSTAIGDAIGLAVKRLQERPRDQRLLVLLTDGRNTSGEVSPQEAAKQAAQRDIRIHTIGVGSDEPVRRGLFGMPRNPSADLDEALLKEVATLTGGQYFRARSTGELEMVYEVINQLEPVEQDARLYRPVTEYYWVLLLTALGLGLTSRLTLPARWRSPEPGGSR